MGGKAQIVIGAEVHHAGLGGGIDTGILRGGNDAFFTPGTGLANGLQLSANGG